MLILFFASTSRRAQSSPRVGFAIRGSKEKDEEDFETREREGFMTEGGEGLRTGSRAGLAPDGPGISDLMSSEYARGWHLTNLRFTSSSSGLRLGRTPENHTTKPELETPKDFRKLDPIGARENSCRFSRVVQEVGTASVSSQSAGLYSQLWPVTKKIVFLPEFIGGWHVGNNQPRAGPLRNV